MLSTWICLAATVAVLNGEPAKRFEVRDAAIFADGRPFPLMMDFTWSAPHNRALFRFARQFGVNVHYCGAGFGVASDLDRAAIDRLYELAAAERLYICFGFSAAHGYRYISEHPEAAMINAAGKPCGEGGVSYLEPGYRAALAKLLQQLCEHVRGKPWHFGYYPQDEHSYRELAGYEDASLKVFRERLMRKYGTLDAVNRAWGKSFARPEDIQPPRAKEPTVAWADWQEHRRWAYLDFTRFVYETLKKHDPDHLVVWSLAFWGGHAAAAPWWDMPPISDVLMRHGIGYSTGAFRLHMLRDIAEWSGKPANILCMPPDYNPGFVQMSFLLDGARTGLSHVCIGGAPEHAYYQGAADSTRGWERKEPIYTASRNMNEFVRCLGGTFLLSRQRPAQVGLFVSDQQVLVRGTEHPSLIGLMLMLMDLNIEFQVFSERNLDAAERLKAVIVGPFSRCVDAKTFDRLRGHRGLVVSKGAFETDGLDRPVSHSLTPHFDSDLGKDYAKGWTDDFAGVLLEDKDAVEANANALHQFGASAEGAVKVRAARAEAVKLRELLSKLGVEPYVRIPGATESVGAVRVKSFRAGRDYWLGFANRVVRAGQDFRSTPPALLHIPFTDMDVAVRLDADAPATAAYLLPLNRLDGDQQRAMPEKLPLKDGRFRLPRLDDTAAVLLTNDYPPLLGLATDRRTALAGDALKFTGRIINSSSKALAGRLSILTDAPLHAPIAPQPFSLAPGEQRDFDFACQLKADAEVGHYVSRCVAEMERGENIVSPSLELAVRASLELSLAQAERTLLPSVDNPSVIELRATKRAAAELQATLDLPEGFVAEPAQAAVGNKTLFRVRDAGGGPGVWEGKLVVSGTVRGAAFRQTFPLRLGRGVLTYREMVEGKPTNQTDEQRLETVALENSRIKVRLIPSQGVVRDLILRETGDDLLCGGTYPYGLVWYAWGKAWQLKNVSPPSAERVEAVMESAAPDGKPVTLTVTLGRDESFVTVVYDCHDAGPVKPVFYLMSRIGLAGKGDVMLAPKRDGKLLRKPWRTGGWTDLLPNELEAPWLAVHNAPSDQTLGVFFDIPALEKLRLNSGQSNFNYMLFHLRPDAPPGRITFRLVGVKGGVEQAQRLLQAK